MFRTNRMLQAIAACYYYVLPSVYTERVNLKQAIRRTLFPTVAALVCLKWIS